MNKVKKIFLKLTSSFLCLWALYHLSAEFCTRQTDGFSIERIHSELAHNPSWEIAPLCHAKQEEIKKILSQEFLYMACGGQCFAFASEDGQYVIKFFKHRIRKPYSYLMQLPLPPPFDKMLRSKLDKAMGKLNRDFTSYKIAYEELSEETGLIYTHLNKGPAPALNVTIVDKLGIKHRIQLDKIEFILQKRAILAYSHIDHLMRQGNLSLARQALRSIIDVIVARCQKGYFDEDARIHRNFGFVGDQPVIIDVGRFIPDSKRKDPLVYRADVVAITKGMQGWLKETHPELIAILNEELNAYSMQN